jgi:hypothetical protein
MESQNRIWLVIGALVPVAIVGILAGWGAAVLTVLVAVGIVSVLVWTVQSVAVSGPGRPRPGGRPGRPA